MGVLLLCLLLAACGSPEVLLMQEEPFEPPVVAASPTRTATPPAAPRTPAPTTTATPKPTIQCDVPEDECLTLIAEPLAEGLDQPVGVVHSGIAGDERLFVVERAGHIRIVEPDGTLRAQPFLDLSEQVRSANWEQGLLGLAFHPRYQENGWFYVYYTDLEGDSQLVRFTVHPDDADIADTGSALTILSVDQPDDDHNGGALLFGPDSYLYLALGDGGSKDSWSNAQATDSLLGSVLRLDVNGGEPYTVPPDNPFVDDPALRDELWVTGLRNPWRVTFDHETGDLFIADVGVASWEEVNLVPAGSGGGQNFGWPCYEGSAPFFSSFCDGKAEMWPPIYTLAHERNACSIIGGTVYRGEDYPALRGHLLLSDLCSDSVWALRADGEPRWQVTARGEAPGMWTSFGEDPTGELYAVAFETGTLFRLGVAVR